MSNPYEHFQVQFADWEILGRGTLPIAEAPVALEPPFRPFYGYKRPRPAIVDDGRRPSFFSRALDSMRPPPLPEPVEEEEPEFQFDFFERASVVEIGVSLPPDYAPKLEAFETLLQQLDDCSDPIALEILGTTSEVKVQFAASEGDADILIGLLRAYFPEAIFAVERDALQSRLEAPERGEAQVIEVGLDRHFFFPLAKPKTDSLIGLVGALSELGENQLGVVQVLFQPVRYPWPQSLASLVVSDEGVPYSWISSHCAETAIKKASLPLFSTVVRLCAVAPTTDQVWSLLTKMAAPLRQFANPAGNHLTPLSNGEDYEIADHLVDLLQRQSRRFGMLLTSEELLGLVHLPSAEVRSPKLKRQVLRSKPAPPALLDGGLYLGDNEHHGVSRAVYLPADQRVRHTHVVGSSGTGKSTLLFNLIMSDIESGQGLTVLDPHGDLVDAVLSEIPDERLNDVILLDPSDETASIAFNILSAHTDAERTMLASDLVSVFERLSTSWGDQMTIVLRNAILAFLESEGGGTLSDLRRFLIDDAFRREFLKSVLDPDVRYYWEKTFPQFSTKQSVGAVVTRLETFLAPKAVRYIVSQDKNTLDFADIMDSGKILLCRLSQGMIGKDNAYLFGSLLVSKIQQTAMTRQRMDASKRRDFWCYIDEFQHFVTPSMAEILTEARKYRLGLILAHQNLAQLQKQHEVASAVMANTNIRIVFRVGDSDAKSLANGFSGFEAGDLQSLERGHAIVRVERGDADFNVQVPLRKAPDVGEAARRRDLAAARSRERYATPRAEVEAELLRKLGIEPGTKATSPPPAPKDEARPAEEILQPKAAQETSPPPLTLTKEPGKGGDEHRAIQQQIKAAAQEAGFKATIEEALSEGGSVDVALTNEHQSIACEITVTTTKDHELLNVQKCLDDDFDIVLLICPNPRKRKRLRLAVQERFPNEIKRIKCLAPSDFRKVLIEENLLEPPGSEEVSPSDAAPTDEVTRLGNKLRRKYAASGQSNRSDEAARLAIIAKLLTGESEAR